uniref:CCHC-type domain-containing protein n=1 Tax=Cynoglossus semilaevis TaxID=244447 RepID=A0A3P8X1B3_CYNSE
MILHTDLQFLGHSGVAGLTEDNISNNNHGALKVNFLQNLSSDIRQAIKLTSPMWEDVTYTCDISVTDHSVFNNEYMVRGNRHKSNDGCRNCGKQGHWAKECWTGSQERNDTHPDSDLDNEYERFKILSDCQRAALLSAVHGNQGRPRCSVAT